MADRAPALLIVLIENAQWRWHVAAIDTDGNAIPLLRSEVGDLDQYRDLEFDSQVSFLRHRLAGALQRGCDRLYPKNLKANHFLLIADTTFPDSADGVTQRLADHFIEWMMNPPASFYVCGSAFRDAAPTQFDRLAGEDEKTVFTKLEAAWPALISSFDQPDDWELISRPPKNNG